MKRLILMGALLFATGCAAQSDLTPTDFLSERQPFDPNRETGGDGYRNVVGDYNARSIVEPKPWGASSQEQTQPEGDGS